VDGIAYYGLLQKWRFDETATLVRIHARAGVVALTLTAAFAFFARLFDATA
jgi:hypothetical protein